MSIAEIRLVVPGSPLSQNRAYTIVVIRPKHRHGMQHASLAMTPEGTAYKKRLWAAAMQARPPAWPLDGTYDLECIYYFDSHRPDGDGPGKLTRDALQNALYKNDRQVRDFMQRRRLDRDNPRLDLTLRLVSPGQVDLLLP